MISVWFPDFYTEAHRKFEFGKELVQHLKSNGIVCTPKREPQNQLIFCGGFPAHTQISGDERLPYVTFCWDLYPFNISESSYDFSKPADATNYSWWQMYLSHLKNAAGILVPSRCTIDRVFQFVPEAKNVNVVKGSVRPFNCGLPAGDEGYVVNVMRKYADPNVCIVADVCRELGISLIETGCSQPWDQFKRIISGARFLISPYYEASTGSLTLLEGYSIGKPVLLAQSPRNGGQDYFDDRAYYFRWNDREHLKRQIQNLYNNPPKLKIEECSSWVIKEYSDSAFARRLAASMMQVLDSKKS